MAEAMDWTEIKIRLRAGASVQILADLNGVTYKTMYNRIMAHQIKDGVTYLTPGNTKGLKKAKAISKTKQAQAREKENAAGLPEAPEKKEERPEAERGQIPAEMVKSLTESEKIPEEVYNMRRQLQPETIEELKEQYRTCLQLAERYQKQAEDWKKIIDTFGTSHPGAQGIPEV